jgi:hypothetical protein
MKNAIQLVIKYAVPALLGLVVFGFLVTQARSCKTIDSLSVQVGILQERTRALDEDAAIKAAERAELQKKHDALLAEHATVAADSAAKDGQLAVGSTERARLKEELAGLKDQGLIIINLTAQVSSLEADLSLAIKDRDDWKRKSIAQDVVIFDLRKECADTVVQYEKEHKARLDYENITNAVVKKNNWTLFGSTVDKVIIVALGVVVVSKVL